MISSAVTVPYSGVDATILVWVPGIIQCFPLHGFYVLIVDIELHMGVREIDIRLLVWIEPGPGDGGHYHCVGGYYTVYYHFGRSAIFVQIYFSITGGKEHS